MATEEQLLAGLKAADAAGNTADAQHFADQIKAMRGSSQPQQAGPQPSLMQTIEASPIGSAVHDLAVGPLNSLVMGAVHKFSDAARSENPNAPAAKIPANFDPIENNYQAALSAQQNRPGYAEARQQAQGIAAGRPASFTDQVTAPLNPTMAGIAGLLTNGVNGMTASADVQRQGQQDYQQQNPTKSAIGQLLGGFMAMPEGAAANVPTYVGDNAAITRMAQGPKPVVQPNPSPVANIAQNLKDIGTAKTAAYKAADAAGVVIKPQSFQQFATDLGTDITKNNVVQADIHPNALSALSVIQDEAASGVPMTLSRADAVRQAVNGAIEKASGVNGSDTDLRMALKVKDGLDKYLDGIGASDVLSGDPTTAVPILKQARALAQQEFKAKQIQQMIDLAHNQASSNYSAAGVEQALRVQFKNLNAQFIKNPSMAAGWTQAERDAIAAVAKGTPGANALRLVGKLAPTGVISGGVGASAGAYAGGLVGGPVGSAIGAAAVPAIGAVARQGATALTGQAADRALATILSGAPLAAAPKALAAPAITSASRIPYGVAASLASILASQPAAAQSQKHKAIAEALAKGN